jgi:hypothetical protein
VQLSAVVTARLHRADAHHERGAEWFPHIGKCRRARCYGYTVNVGIQYSILLVFISLMRADFVAGSGKSFHTHSQCVRGTRLPKASCHAKSKPDRFWKLSLLTSVTLMSAQGKIRLRGGLSLWLQISVEAGYPRRRLLFPPSSGGTKSDAYYK